MAFWKKLFKRGDSATEEATESEAATVAVVDNEQATDLGSAPDPLDAPGLFEVVPNPSEMSQQLGEIIRQRRTIRTVFANLAAALEIEMRLDEDPLEEQCEAALKRMLERSETRLNRDTVAAFCLVTEQQLGNQLEVPLRFSQATLVAASGLFGVELDEEQWPQVWGEGAEDLEGLKKQVAGEAYTPVVESLKGLSSSRTALDILSDLGRELPSKRAENFAEAMRPKLPEGEFRVNDEQQALLPLLRDAGYKVHPHTLMGLCLFVDVEVGNITREHLENLAEAADTFDSSMYAMVSAAGAFGLTLNGLVVDDLMDEPTLALAALASTTEHGVLACFRKPGEEGRWWERIQNADEARRVADLGLEFTGLVLASMPSRECSFAELEFPVVAAVSGSSGARVWERWEEAGGEDGYLGEILKPASWQRQGWPESLTELDKERLLGWTDALSKDFLRLRWMSQALRQVLRQEADPRLSARLNPGYLEKLVEILESPRVSLAQGLIEQNTVAGLTKSLKHDMSQDLLLYQPLAEALREDIALSWLTLQVLHCLCVDDAMQLEGAMKQFDPTRLQSALNQRSAQHLSAENPRERELAAQLLVTENMVVNSNARMVVEAELMELLSDSELAVARAAVQGLVRLALADFVPLPGLVRLRAMSDVEGLASRLPEEIVEKLLEHLQEWVKEQRSENPTATFPFTGKKGKLNKDKSRPLVELLAALEQACSDDKTDRKSRHFVLATNQQLRGLGNRMLRSWRLLGELMGKDPASLSRQVRPEELLQEHKTLLESIKPEEHPSFGGGHEPLTIYHVGPFVDSGVYIFEADPPNPPKQWSSPMFAQLVELSRRVDIREVRLLRFVPTEEDSLGGLDKFDLSFKTRKAYDIRNLEVLRIHQTRFIPLSEELPLLLAPDQAGPEWRALEAFLHLYQGGIKSLRWRAYLSACAAADNEPKEEEVQRRLPDAAEREQIARTLSSKLALGQDASPRLARLIDEEFEAVSSA